MAKKTTTPKSGVIQVDPAQCVISKLNSRVIPATNERIAELAEDIQSQGQLQPVLGRPIDGGKFEVFAGGNRLRAVTLLNEMKADGEAPLLLDLKVVEGEDKATLIRSISENEFRTASTIIDRANSMRRLIEECSMTQAEVAHYFHVSEATVTQTLKVLKLNQKVQKAIVNGEVPEDTARLLANVPKDEQAAILEDAVKWHEYQAERLDEIEGELTPAAEGEEAEPETPAADGKKAPAKAKKSQVGKVAKKGQKATREDIKKSMKSRGHADPDEGKPRSRSQLVTDLEALDTSDQSPAARRLMRNLIAYMNGEKSTEQLGEAFARALPKAEKVDAAA